MNYIFYVWCTAIVLIVNQNPKTNILVILLSIGYLTFKTKRWTLYWLVILIVFNTMLIQVTPSKPKHKIMEVIDVKEDYVVGQSDKQKVYVYNVSNVNYHDIIEIDGTYEPITSIKNLHTFSFERYANQEGAYYQMYAYDFTVLAKSESIRATVYNFFAKLQNPVKPYFMKVFYNQKTDMMDMTFLSGFHIYLLAKIIGKRTKLDRWLIVFVVSVLGLIAFPLRFYLLSLGIRAFIHLLFPAMHHRHKTHLWAFALLWYNPNYLYHLGYVISVSLATISLFNVQKRSRFIVTLLVLIPIHLYFFHEANIFSILFFTWIQLANTVMFVFAILALMIPPISGILTLVLQFQQSLSSFKIEWLTIYGLPSVIWLIVWGYLTLCIISFQKRKHGIGIVLLLLMQYHIQYLHPVGEVMFMDVGQGDTIFIQEPFFGKTMLIDVAGHLKKDLVEDVIYPVLKAKGVRKLDVVAISHDDYDHSGGLKKLQERMLIHQVVREGNIKLKELEFINLNENSTSKDENERSMVLFANIYGFNYLFTGDAGHPVEEQIMQTHNKLKIDILKVSHHGSNSGTSAAFLATVRPRVSIISSGHNNIYGHPHDEVIENLQKQRTHSLNTQEHGSLHFYFIKNVQLFRTATQEFGIITKE